MEYHLSYTTLEAMGITTLEQLALCSPDELGLGKSKGDALVTRAHNILAIRHVRSLSFLGDLVEVEVDQPSRGVIAAVKGVLRAQEEPSSGNCAFDIAGTSLLFRRLQSRPPQPCSYYDPSSYASCTAVSVDRCACHYRYFCQLHLEGHAASILQDFARLVAEAQKLAERFQQKKQLEAIAALSTPPPVEEAVPEDLFAPIVGHDNVKQILRWAIDAKGRVGVLLQGPPASAKTLFLMELARLPDSYYCLAQTMSGPGLALALRLYEPRHLVIDEIDRLDPRDVGVLNSLLATGLVVETKVGKGPPIHLNTKTFAAGIHIEELPADLLSRFLKLRFPPYTPEQFAAVCLHILPKEGCDGETAALIASEVWGMRGERADIREAVQIARLAQGDRGRVEELLRTLRQMGV